VLKHDECDNQVLQGLSRQSFWCQDWLINIWPIGLMPQFHSSLDNLIVSYSGRFVHSAS
jgi:hypothetical protein